MKKFIFLGLLSIFILSACTAKTKDLTIEEAKVKAADFITNNLVQPGTQISIKEVVEENGLYKVVVNLPDGQEIDSYITKDGSKFFPQVLDVAETEAASANSEPSNDANQQAQAVDVPKTEKPVVEAFVMSHCPYGTQIEKGLLPVIKTLGDKADISIKFVSYAMHDELELDEQLAQHCIQEEQSDKFLEYLECFLIDGDTDRCLAETKINTDSLDTCVAATDKEFKVKELFADKTTWSGGKYPQFNIHKEENLLYGVQGSPTLVVNGTTVNSARDSASLLGIICSGFEEQPEECNTQLSQASPAPGFGTGTTQGATDASCN